MTENVVREFAENGAARAKDATKVMEQTYSAASNVATFDPTKLAQPLHVCGSPPCHQHRGTPNF
jgi:hypothetical protein